MFTFSEWVWDKTETRLFTFKVKVSPCWFQAGKGRIICRLYPVEDPLATGGAFYRITSFPLVEDQRGMLSSEFELVSYVELKVRFVS